MRETRAGRYGKNLSIWIEGTINTFPKDLRENYKKIFLEELRIYSFQSRKKGEPRNAGCVHELSDLTEVDISNPRHLSKLVKEGIHLMYQKDTAALVFDALIEYLEKKIKFSQHCV